MKSIENDIANGNIKNIYLLMGVEPYLINQFRDKLVDALVGKEDEINYKKLTGSDFITTEMIEFADTIPFFAEHRVVVVENSGVFKTADDKLAEYFSKVPESSYLIFTECFMGDKSDEKKYEKHLVDKRLKIYKSLNANGRIVEFPRQKDEVLNKWINTRLQAKGFSSSYSTRDKLLEYTGNDMMTILNEIEKLMCYKLEEKVIETDDVEVLCSKSIENDIFEMVAAIAAKNKRKALALYYDLLQLKESPIKILYLISREFNLLMQVKSLKKEGVGDNKISSTTGVNPYFIGKYVNISNRLSNEYLREAIGECLDFEHAFKRGGIDPTIGVELLIVKYSTVAGQA